jgi:hypothetical protein
MAQATTQDFLEVDKIKSGVLILKNRAVRGVLMVSSQNFALKAADEQEAIIFQFQNFLNSLDFPIQILIQSRRLNITGYIDYLKSLEENQQNALLKRQTADYRAFVEQLIQGGSIMSKVFFVTVPFTWIETVATESTKKSLFAKPKISGELTDEEFQRMKNQLWQRMEFVAMGLRRTGLKAIPLNSEELIELLWSWHHPQEAEVGYYPQIPPEVLQ